MIQLFTLTLFKLRHKSFITCCCLNRLWKGATGNVFLKQAQRLIACHTSHFTEKYKTKTKQNKNKSQQTDKQQKSKIMIMIKNTQEQNKKSKAEKKRKKFYDTVFCEKNIAL